MVNQETKNTINSLIAYYQNKQKVLTDVCDALSKYGDLKPRSRVYPGYGYSYLTLDGTIPVKYKSNTYNIPVLLWIFNTYPNGAPQVLVQPTATMTIKVSQQVDKDGKVSIPYLRDWTAASDILKLINNLTQVFGESPPVFAKSKNSNTPSSVNNPLPYPVTQNGMPQPYGAPPSGPSFPQPYPASGTAGYGMYGQPGQIPPYPQTNYNSYAAQPPASSFSAPASYPSYSTPSSYPTPYPSYPPSYPNNSEYQNPGAKTSNPYNCSSKLSEDEIKSSLLSAVEGNARRLFKDMIDSYSAEMEVLKNTHTNLESGKSMLEDFEKVMKNEMDECGAAIKTLESRIPILKEELEKRAQEQICPAEEAIQTTAPVYKQLLQVYAEEQAIDDVLYILAEGLRKEIISLELYLKKVKELSRKQFLLKALVQKCREKAGLSEIYSSN